MNLGVCLTRHFIIQELPCEETVHTALRQVWHSIEELFQRFFTKAMARHGKPLPRQGVIQWRSNRLQKSALCCKTKRRAIRGSHVCNGEDMSTRRLALRAVCRRVVDLLHQ
eukprot:2343702-Amphidinium_carterae.1